MDKNSVTGIVLIMGMLLGYQYFFGSQDPVVKENVKAKVEQTSKTKVIANQASNIVAADSSQLNFKEEQYTLENNDIKIIFSNKGGKIVSVQLKNYFSYQNYSNKVKQGLFLFDSKKDAFEVEIPTLQRKVKLGELNYTSQGVKSNQISFESVLPSGEIIKQFYTLSNSGYELTYSLDAKSLAGKLAGTEYTIHWKENITQSEKDIAEERKATINYLIQEDEEFDNLTENPSSIENENLSNKLAWVSFKKKYFVSGLIPQGFSISKANLTSTPNLNDTVNIKTLDAQLVLPNQNLIQGVANFKFYFGPNDYSIVKHVAPAFGKNVKLSYDFLLPLTKYIYVPLFDFLESLFSNYGLLIIVLVLIIKSALLPLTYKSYVSMAKTRILAPEIAAIKEKIGDDAAKVQQETMKLYSEVGVNPLSGCIPVLATMPILMAVFLLFPNLINLRQESFLWSNDLSTYDSFINLPFTIPFYGSHVSLFCLLMTVSQLAYGYYNNQITPDQPGQPIDMKKMAYITPVIFMFVMNSFPAGLSFYYFISNLVTIGQQLAIRKFVDEDKIKLILDDNRKKIAAGGGAKKSKFSQYLQTQMKAMEENQKNAANSSNKKKK
ncbi:membrane protein insertase YidC [Aquirufa sp. ROCK2-A2]